MPLFAEVILPLPLPGTFTYIVPEAFAPHISEGSRVVVPFGKRKSYTGIVASVSPLMPSGPAGLELKEVTEVLDDGPILRRPQRRFWEWVAEYYFCTVGEVMKAALPAGLKLESETFVEPVADWEEDCENARHSPREVDILARLGHAAKPMSVGDLARKIGVTSVSAAVSRLIAKGAVTVQERISERFKPRREVCLRLLIDRDDPQALDAAFESVRRSPRQETLLLALVEMSDFARREVELQPVVRRDVMERVGVTADAVAALRRKGLIEQFTREISRFAPQRPPSGQLPELSPAQSVAHHAIHESWRDHSVTLLHGVTSSGKTEIYIHLIDAALRAGHQALYLVPEIALTTQLTSRLQDVFGSQVVIYHSKFTDNQRVEIWRRMLDSTDPCVVVGARSSIFLPFAGLGLVIVDEEHESAFKQQDPAPRYNARDAAMVLAAMHGAKTLLGSATPAIDTYYKAESGRYGLVTLSERFAGAMQPEMRLVDLGLARRKGELNGPFARETVDLVRQSLSAGHQSILFLNRRGFAPVAECPACAYVPRCPNCDVALTYHRYLDRLVCHYCGSTRPLPGVCPACRTGVMEVSGYGTERIEESVAEAFPDASVARMDLDTTRNKDAYHHLITDFSTRKYDILVGTQMIAKGLDFAGVDTVAVVNADAQISQPDFRAAERAFNMIEQVAGRAGRRDNPGVVAIQTRQPEHPLFAHLIAHDYLGFYRSELEQRRAHGYPPFTRIIVITVRHPERSDVEAVSRVLADRLRELLGNRVLGPEEPPVSRVQSLYIRRIMLKIEAAASMKRVREVVSQTVTQLRDSRFPPALKAIIHYDVDPV